MDAGGQTLEFSIDVVAETAAEESQPAANAPRNFPAQNPNPQSKSKNKKGKAAASSSTQQQQQQQQKHIRNPGAAWRLQQTWQSQHMWIRSGEAPPIEFPSQQQPSSSPNAQSKPKANRRHQSPPPPIPNQHQKQKNKNKQRVLDHERDVLSFRGKGGRGRGRQAWRPNRRQFDNNTTDDDDALQDYIENSDFGSMLDPAQSASADTSSSTTKFPISALASLSMADAVAAPLHHGIGYHSSSSFDDDISGAENGGDAEMDVVQDQQESGMYEELMRKQDELAMGIYDDEEDDSDEDDSDDLQFDPDVNVFDALAEDDSDDEDNDDSVGSSQDSLSEANFEYFIDKVPNDAHDLLAEEDVLRQEFDLSRQKGARRDAARASQHESTTADNGDADDLQSTPQLRKHRKQQKKEKRAQDRRDAQSRRDHGRQFYNLLKLNGGAIAMSKDTISSVQRINEQIHAFVVASHEPAQFMLSPMPGPFRNAMGLIASQYELVSKTAGKKHEKCVVLYRTRRTNVPKGWASLPYQILGKITADQRRADRRFDARAGGSRDRKKDKKDKKGKMAAESPGGGADPHGVKVAPKVGHVVGGAAQPIGQTNIGHRMLLAMGWSPGQSLGVANDGIVEPVKAVVRSKRGGLGGD